ncbi:MAG: hypothetical protein PGN26_03975 [Xylophilus ampelinus]
MDDEDDGIAFAPYANESEVIRIGGLEIGNRIDRIAIAGDLVLTKDAEGLALAKELQALAGRIVLALEASADLPGRVQVVAASTVKNPFT